MSFPALVKAEKQLNKFKDDYLEAAEVTVI